MLSLRAPRPAGQRRRAAAAVEMAVLLPLLAFLFAIAVDFARVFYYSVTVANCARNGALWASDKYYRGESTYPTLEKAALADAPNLHEPGNPPRVTSTTGTESNGNAYVEVTVAYDFHTITHFPGVPSMTIERTVRMAIAPDNPKANP